MIKCEYCNSEAETICCDHCDEVVLNWKTTDDGYKLCNDCYENATTCDNCGDVYRDDYSILAIADGGHICEHCYNENYFTCNCCDEIYHNNNANETVDGLVCDSCYTEYYVCCDHCGEAVYNEYVYYTADNYDLCEGCWNEHTYEDEDGEYWYSQNGAVIKNYSYKPAPLFQGEGPLFFGIELEIGKILDGNSRQKLAKTLLDEVGRSVYIKDDGSLENGFEIVTHPLSFNFIKNSQFFEKIESTLYGKARAYNKGGMHVHINRSAFISDEHLQNFVKFINIYSPFSSFVAQRKSDRWAKYYAPSGLNEVDLETKYNPGENDRYMSINFENHNTIEVRIFNANILTNRNYKNVEFLHAIFQFSKNNAPDIAKFLAFIGGNKELYSNLLSFIKERKNSFKKVLNFKIKTWKDNFKALAKFLKEKKVYSYFIEIADKKALIRALKNYPEEAINFTIHWESTIQGHKFWMAADEEWKKIIKEEDYV